MSDAPFTLTNPHTGEVMTPEKVPLPPLSEVDTDAFDEGFVTTLAPFQKCPHPQDKLTLLSSTHVQCSLCGAGWTGIGVHQLLQTSHPK